MRWRVECIERRVDRDDVARRQKGREIDQRQAGPAGSARVAADDVVADGGGPDRQRAADPAHADDAKALARRPSDSPGQSEIPRPVLHASVERDDSPCQREDEAEGVIGDLVRAVIRDVADGYSELGGSHRVDGIESDAIASDGADAWQGTEDLPRDRGVLDDEGRRIDPGIDDRVGRPTLLEPDRPAGGRQDVPLDVDSTGGRSR